MPGTLPGTYCTSVPQAIIIFAVLLRDGGKQFKIHGQVCAASVHLGGEGATTYGLSPLRTSNNPAPSHSHGQLSPLKWLPINREFVLIERGLALNFPAYI